MVKQQPVSDEVRQFFSKIGKKSGEKIKSEVEAGVRDKDYFSKISKMRKTYGRQKLQEDAIDR